MKKPKMNLLTKNMLTNTFGTVLLKSLPLIATPIISILLTPEEYGNVSIFLTWVSLIGVFIGLQVSGSIQNALLKYGQDNIKSYCSSILSMAFLSFLAFFVPSVILRNVLSNLLGLNVLTVCLIVPTCFASFCVSFLSSYFLSLKQAKRNLLLTFLTSLIVTAMSLLCVYLIKPGYMGYVVGYSSTYVLIGFTIFFIFVIKNRKFFSKEYWKFCLLFSLPLIFHMLSNTALSQCDKLMIQYINNDTYGVGIYNMMHTVASVTNSLWSAMNAAFVPFYYDYLKDNNVDELRSRIKHYAFAFIAIICGFMLVCPELTSLLINEQYLSGLKLIPVMIWTAFFTFLYSFAVNFEFYHTKTIWIAIGTICAAIINIVLNYFLLMYFGIMGVAVATVISYFFLFVFHELIARLIIKNYPVRNRFNFICILIMCVFTLVTYLLWNFMIIRIIIFACVVGLFIFKIVKTKIII